MISPTDKCCEPCAQVANGFFQIQRPQQKHTMKKVLIIGLGGVGTISALALWKNQKCEVTLVVRSDYDRMVKDGVTIKLRTHGTFEGWRPHHVALLVEKAREEIGEFDYILLTTKNIPDSGVKCEDIVRPAVTPRLVIILLQNGLGIEVPMIEAFPNNIILLGVSLIASAFKNGVIENPGKDHVLLGDFRAAHNSTLPGTQEAMEEFCSMYQDPDPEVNHIAIDPECETTRWQKLLYNSVFNVITAIVEMDATRCQIVGVNDTLFRPAMREVIAIAKLEGVTIPEDTIERFIHIGDGMFYLPLMCVDRRKNQLIEMEVILGNPLKVAKKNGVATPILSTCYQLLKLVQFKTMEARGMVTIDEADYQGSSDDYKPPYEYAL